VHSTQPRLLASLRNSVCDHSCLLSQAGRHFATKVDLRNPKQQRSSSLANSIKRTRQQTEIGPKIISNLHSCCCWVRAARSASVLQLAAFKALQGQVGQPRCSAKPACILFGIQRKRQVMSRLHVRVSEFRLMLGSRNYCMISSSRLCSTTVHMSPTAFTCGEKQQSKVCCKSDSHMSTARLAPSVSIQKTISCCKSN